MSPSTTKTAALASFEAYQNEPSSVAREDVIRTLDRLRGTAPADPTILGALATCFRDRYTELREPNDLNRAIDYLDQSLGGPKTSAEWKALAEIDPHTVITFVSYLNIRSFLPSAQPDDLSRSIEIQNALREVTDPEDPLYVVILSHLAQAHEGRFAKAGQQDDIDQAVLLSYLIVLKTPASHARYPNRILTWAVQLHRRYTYAREILDLDLALRQAKLALSLTTSPETRRWPLTCLGAVYQDLSELWGKAEDLKAAVTYKEEALAVSLALGAPDVEVQHNEMAWGYVERGQEGDFDRAVRAGETALKTTDPEGQLYVHVLDTLANAYIRRFEQTRDTHDLEVAEQYTTRALKGLTSNSYYRPNFLATSARIQWARFRSTSDPVALDRAVTEIQSSIDDTRDNDARLLQRLTLFKECLDQKQKLEAAGPLNVQIEEMQAKMANVKIDLDRQQTLFN